MTIVDEHLGSHTNHTSSPLLDATLERSDSDSDGDFIQVQGTSGTMGETDCTPQDAVVYTQPAQSLQQSSSSQMLEGHTQVAHVFLEDIIPAQLLQHSPRHSSGDDIVPLAMSPDRWVAPSTINQQACIPSYSPEQAKRRFTGLLNKLARVNIGFICDRLIAWVDECEEAVHGNVLELFSQLLFDRAVDEPERTGIYISLCEAITEKLRGRYFCHGVKTGGSYGQSIISNSLVKCWNDAQGSLSWGESIFGSQTAASATMLSVDDYYAAQKAKRRGLGLASIGIELWNSNVLSNPEIDHLWQRLDGDPKEGDVVTLCILARTVDHRYFNGRSTPRAVTYGLRGLKTRLQCCMKVTPPSGYLTEFQLHELAVGSARSLLHIPFPCNLSQFSSSYNGKYLFQRQHLILKLRKHAETNYSVLDESRWFAAKIPACPNPPRLDCSFELLHHDDKWWLVQSFVMRVLHGQDENSTAKAPEVGFCCPEGFEKGFTAAAHFLDVAATRYNRAYHLMAIMLKSAGFDKEEEMVIRIASKVKESKKLVQLTLW